MDLWQRRTIPYLARANYVQELRHILPWSALAGLVEGQFSSVVVSRTFEGTAFHIAIATLTPYASYMFSLLWGMLCVGRPKIRLLRLFATGTAFAAAMIGFIPPTSAGTWWFLAQMALAQVLMAGVVTVRSAIWRSNYPTYARGQITSRVQGTRTVISVLAVQAASAISDYQPHAYRWIYPLAAVLGGVGILMLARVRVRGEKRELRRHERPAERADATRGFYEPFSLTALLSPHHVLGRMAAVFRNDPRFSVYSIAQFLHGASNLITLPITVAVISRDLPIDDAWGYWVSGTLVSTLPMLSLFGSLRRWGRLFDGMGVLRFRVVNVLCWLVAILLAMVATELTLRHPSPPPALYLSILALFALRGVVHGISHGGGTLAWNLGHLHFAKSSEAEVYMGIHVFLAGVRGLLAPLLGMWLWTCGGWSVWMVALGCSVVSLFMYAGLARRERREAAPAPTEC